MSADRRPSCGLADRVLSILTARTGPSAAPGAPVNGWVRAGDGVDDGDEPAETGGGGDAAAVTGPFEQAARAAVANVVTSTAARAGVVRKQRTTCTSGQIRRPEVARL